MCSEPEPEPEVREVEVLRVDGTDRSEKRRELALTANLTQSYWLPTRRFTTAALAQGNIDLLIVERSYAVFEPH